MAFEIFERQGNGQKPEFSLNCRPDLIIMNKRVSKFLLDFKRVNLLWDKEAKRVAIAPLSPEDTGGYRISRGKSGTFSWVTCTAFLRATGLAGSGAFFPTWNSVDGRLEWEIETAQERKLKRRKLSVGGAA